MAEVADEALALAAAGFAVFPCHSIRDGRCSCGQECGSPAKHPRVRKGCLEATTDSGQVGKWWAQWPDANIGLATGKKHGIWVLDVDRRENKDGFLWLEAMSGLQGMPHVPSAITPSGGAHFFFSYPADGRAVRQGSDRPAKGVDVRSDGGYVIAAPSNHAHGGIYAWEDAPHEWDAEIPQAPEWLLEMVCGEVVDKGVGDKTKVVIPMDDEEIAEIRSALSFVNPDDRDVWRNVGFALHSEHADHIGFAIWDEWSKASTKYEPRRQRYEWNRYDSGGGIGMATLFKYAIDAGWSKPERSFSVDELRLWEPSADIAPLESSHWSVPGLLGEIVAWILSTALYPRPRLALGAAISMLGAMYGRRYASETNARTNVFCVGVAPSGSGKDHAIGCISTLLDRSGCGEIEGGSSYTSGAALLAAMNRTASREPLMLCQIDEFGKMLAAMGRPGANSRADIPAELMKIYSSPHRIMRGTEYAGRERIDLMQPHLCVHGTTTPEAFFSSMSSVETVDGFLNRLIAFTEPTDWPDEQAPAPRDPPDALVAAVAKAKDHADDQISLPGVMTPSPLVVTYRLGAKAVLSELDSRIKKKRAGHLGALWARSKEQAIKLALIRAVGMDGVRPSISDEDMRWACDVIWRLTAATEASCADRIGDNDHERQLKRVLQFVRDAGKTGCRHRALTRGTRSIRPDLRGKILEDLQDSGDIAVKKEGRSNVYFATRGE
ncbi:MAG: bifunctional DNA primase/polymerase [Aequoribacter sp.]|uniref:bifunctional DNA primase/polymerase n=1 Tax=Aequoribacter sp. TaxID=2847771 RepID=UPI003C3AC8CB